jgi:hypothetical protein
MQDMHGCVIPKKTAGAQAFFIMQVQWELIE